MFVWMPPTEAADTRPALDEEPENPPSAPDFFMLPESPLRAIRDFAGMPLGWEQGETGFFRQTFRLWCEEEILGFLRIERNWWGGCRGVARTKEGAWSFRHSWNQEIIESDRGGRTLARVSHAGPFMPRGSTLYLPNGKYREFFDRTWLAADNAPLVTFKMTHGFKGISSEVEVHPPGAALPELDLLITLGWYLAIPRGGGGGGGGGGGCGGCGGCGGGGGGCGGC
jgi:hypothetical protein